MKQNYLLLAAFILPFYSLEQLFTPGAGVADVDGNAYQTVIINGHEWMAENLRTSKYANGDPIPNVIDNAQWSSLTTGAWAHYNNDSQYENIYGKLYNWYTTADARNVCPTDWHVPTDAEYTGRLIYYIDPSSIGNSLSQTAGSKMKSVGSQNWACPNSDATNETGFSALAGGMRAENGLFNGVGWDATLWTSTEFDNGAIPLTDAWYRQLSCSSGGAYRAITSKKRGWTIRCMKNYTSSINEITPSLKSFIKVFDIQGNETVITPNELQFYLYSDGSIEKKIIVE